MKTYYKAPTKEVRIVRPNADEQEWEFWVLVPQRIGGGRRLGTRRIRSENGGEYQNLVEMLVEDLRANNHVDLAAEFEGTAVKMAEVSGLDLVATGKWPVFCAMRKIDPKNVKAMQQIYALAPAEAKKLEIGE